MGVNGITLKSQVSVRAPAQVCEQGPSDLVSRILTSLDPGSLPEGP